MRRCRNLLLVCLVVMSACFLTSCAGGNGSAGARSATAETPARGQVTSTSHPLVAQYTYTTFRDATVTVEFGPDVNYGFKTSPQSTPAGGGQVTVLVAGMRPSTTYHMRAVIDFADGSERMDQDHTFTTGALPSGREPQLSATQPGSTPPNPGVELLDLTPGPSNQLKALAADLQGNVIWYYDIPETNGTPEPIKLLPNGHFLIVVSDDVGANLGTFSYAREIDLAGNIIREISSSDLNTKLAAAGSSLTIANFHHDIIALPNGHWILLANHEKDFTDLPGYPGTTAVYGDVLVDVDENFNPVWVWDAFDHTDVLSVTRQQFGSLPDWLHSNAVLYSPDEEICFFPAANRAGS